MRFKIEKHRRRFIAGRGILRDILGKYLQIGSAEIEFAYGGAGKPSLAGINAGALQFNLSHSDDLAVFAVSLEAPIGIDVEVIHPIEDLDEIAKQNFSAAECTAVSDFTGSSSLEAFFNCWTRKEAYVKAHGSGLAMPLDSFDVGLDQSETFRILHSLVRSGDVSIWSVYHWKPSHDSIAALALAIVPDAIIIRDWDTCAIRLQWHR